MNITEIVSLLEFVHKNLQSDTPLFPDRYVLYILPEYIDITEELVGCFNLVARYFPVRKIIATLFFGEPLKMPPLQFAEPLTLAGTKPLAYTASLFFFSPTEIPFRFSRVANSLKCLFSSLLWLVFLGGKD